MWKRKSKLVHCFRKDFVTRGHNTNIIEVSIRILKDFVLQRCKAFNAVSLSGFITHSLEAKMYLVCKWSWNKIGSYIGHYKRVKQKIRSYRK